MTPTSRLHAAATRLRALAEAATPGPWMAEVLGSEGYFVREVEGKPRPGSRIPRRVRVARCGYEDWDTDKANAAYVAAMSPPVALALADWLALVARLLDQGFDTNAETNAALAVADAINEGDTP